MAAINAKQSAICDFIRASEGRTGLNVLIHSIDFDDLRALLWDYVNEQQCDTTIIKMFYATRSVQEAIGTDCIKYMMGYLAFTDICRLSRVNKEFKTLCNPHFDRKLLAHPIFAEFFHSEIDDNGRKLDICFKSDIEDDQLEFGYLLQNKYQRYYLNKFSFKELGQKQMLKGDDSVVWELCNHFGFETDLFQCIEEGDGAMCQEPPFEDCTDPPYTTTENIEDNWFNAYNEWNGGVCGKKKVPIVPKTIVDVYNPYRREISRSHSIFPVVRIQCDNPLDWDMNSIRSFPQTDPGGISILPPPLIPVD